jgi:CYTH domain-containing protein
MAHACDDVRRRFHAIERRMQKRLEVLQRTEHLLEPARTPTFARAFAENLQRHLDDLQDALARIRGPEDEDEAHDARIRGKRLRYLVEPLRPFVPEAAPLFKASKRLQDVLGDLNDARVLRQELGAALEKAAVEQARRLHDLARQEDREAFQREARRSPRAGLLELTRRVQRRAQKLYDRLVTRWLVDDASAMEEIVRRIVDRLSAADERSVEIERKFLLTGRPEIPEDAVQLTIEQGWLPGDRLRERVRRIEGPDGVACYRTVKLGRGITRTEVEEETPADLFAALWPLTVGCRVRKRRYVVANGERTWEVDVFEDRDLVLAEVELEDPAEDVTLPAWLEPWIEREVTEEPGWTNLELAR